jgi:hypothetical protein
MYAKLKALPPRLATNADYDNTIRLMAESSFEAINVCTAIFDVGETTLQGSAETFKELDKKRIYDKRIWTLYSDVCGEDFVRMLRCLRKFGPDELHNAIDAKTPLRP